MDHLYNLKQIHSKLKTETKLYKVYNFVMGMPGQLTIDQLKEIKKLTGAKHRVFTKRLEREIKELTKKANNSKKSPKSKI